MTRRRIVLDTNVPTCANGHTEQASPRCVIAAVARLLDVTEGRASIVLDDGWKVIAEYRKHLSGSGQPGPGDAFLKWLLTNRENGRHVKLVSVTPHTSRGYVEFPDDPTLASFDWDDRIFVALALAARERRKPPIVNATDTDWKAAEGDLLRHGVRVEFLCPELMSSHG